MEFKEIKNSQGGLRNAKKVKGAPRKIYWLLRGSKSVLRNPREFKQDSHNYEGYHEKFWRSWKAMRGLQCRSKVRPVALFYTVKDLFRG